MRFLYGSILAVLLATTVFSQPPIVVPEGGFADHTIPVPKGAAIVWRYSPTPIQKAKDLAPGRVIFTGEKGKTYTATAIIVVVNFETREVSITDTDYLFTFGGKPVDPKDPDPVDPVPKLGKLFFVCIRPDAPADPTFTKVMSLPEWQTLKGMGHGISSKTVKEAEALGIKLPATVTLPTVVTLRNNPNGKTSTVVRGPVDLPGTGAGILNLLVGVQ